MPHHDDIRGQLREDHASFLAELEALRIEGDAHRSMTRLRALRHAWAVHSLAEESVVYNPLETLEGQSSPVVHSDERFIEHELIEDLFEKLERGRPGTLEWRARLKVTRDLVTRHIENEELDVFARLARQLDAARLGAMADAFVAERERFERLEERKAA